MAPVITGVILFSQELHGSSTAFDQYLDLSGPIHW